MKKKIKVKNISCTNCAKTIKNALTKFYPQLVVKVNINNSVVLIEGEFDMNNVIFLLKQAGYPPADEEEENLKKEIIISVVLTLPLLISMFGHFAPTSKFVPMVLMNGYLQFLITLFLLIYIGKRFYKSAYLSLKNGVLGMDALVVIGITTAFIYSSLILFFSNEEHPTLYFEVSAVVVTVMLIGKAMEYKVKMKTTDNLNDLVNLSVKQATVIRDGKESLVDVSDLKIDDIVISLANEKIPIDGEIVSGTTIVDESSFTGESVAVTKKAGDQVLAGTLNLGSNIKFKVTKLENETVLSQIIEAVDEASLVETKYQKIADKVASIFVPLIIVIAIITFIINYYLSGDLNLSLGRSLSVILISCPCALGLATPTSIMVANGIAAKRGILYQGKIFFEIGSKIEVICFDKTGTLTKGSPILKNYDFKDDTLQYAYNLEKLSKHPVSKAFVEKFSNIKELEVADFTVLPGFGISGTVDHKKVLIGNVQLFEKEGIKTNEYLIKYQTSIASGYTTNLVAVDGICVGIYGVFDELKESAKEVVQELQKLGIETVMITGDNDKVANIVAKQVGINKVHSKVLPVNKADIVKEYQDQGLITAFIGDGINDTVALTTADIAISVASGNDIAINSSDVTFLHDDLHLILDGMKISKETRANIFQNLFWAFSYNIIAVPLAATGYLNMLVAAIAMGFSSIVVVLNALRLNNMKFDD